jgi:hypothetical protein
MTTYYSPPPVFPGKKRLALGRWLLRGIGRRPQVRQPDFKAIAQSALASSGILVPRWLPDGRLIANEWIARNPTRDDHKLGSFKINLKSGRWADFATGDAGGDLISFRAYLDDVRQGEAARRIAQELGLP